MEILVGTFFAIVCILLIVIVLLQKGRGGGLGAAFGGAASSAFGTRVGDVLTWVTIALVALFLILAVVVVMVFRQEGGQVATPMFNPPENFTNEEIVVTITCETPGAMIYYTIDGSEPDESSNSRKYVSSLTIEPGTTLMAKAFRAGKDPSETQSGYYGVPVTPPAAPAILPGAGLDGIEPGTEKAIPAPAPDANMTPAVPTVDANLAVN